MSTDTDPYASYAHGELIYDQTGIMNHWGKMQHLTNIIEKIVSLEWTKIKLESFLHTKKLRPNTKGTTRKLLGKKCRKIGLWHWG